MKKFLSAFAAVTLLCANAVLMSCSSDDDSISTTGTPLTGTTPTGTTPTGTTPTGTTPTGTTPTGTTPTKYTCTNCNTEYDTEAKKNNCAEQIGCPNKFYETAVNIDGTSATASSTYVYFGVFPKTVLPKANESIITTETVEMGANTYYKGTDGNYYAKVLENACGSGTEYKYTDGTQASVRSANSYRYFKVEPIKWKVLTTDYNSTGKALLLADDILTTVPYYDYVPYFGRTINNATVYANNYKYSTIRAYLNGSYESGDSQTKTYENKGFLQTAFTSTAQGKIATTTVDNTLASTGDTTNRYCCDNTDDKIFLLSVKEVETSEYRFSSNNDRIRKTTDYAKANLAHQSDIDGYGGWWWIRSPSYRNINPRDVSNDGDTYRCTRHEDCTLRNSGGVVPALSISF